MKKVLFNDPKLLLDGFSILFFASYGQTFFISLFNTEIRLFYSLSDGEFGLVYAVATLSSSASGSLKSHGLQNIQVSYTSASETTITVGVRNLNDKDPVIASGYEWNSYLYDIYGRTYTVKLEQRF